MHHGNDGGVCAFVAQACPTLCDPMDCSAPGSSVHGLLQARILKWVATSFSRIDGSYVAYFDLNLERK